jgi:hypothetical protein
MSECTDKNFTRQDWELIEDTIIGRLSYLKKNLEWMSNPSRFDLNQVEHLKTLLEKSKSNRRASNIN